MINQETALAYRGNLERVLAGGDTQAKREFLRKGIEGVTLYPEELRVEIRYRVPDFVMHEVVAGAGFEPATSRL